MPILPNTGSTTAFTPIDSAPALSRYLVTCVNDNKDMTVYLNGQFSVSDTFDYDTGSTTPDSDLLIGARLSEAIIDNHFDGIVDHVG